MSDPTEFFKQLNEWAVEARLKLEAKDLKSVNRLMFLIRGTSLVFGYFQIAHLTHLGEGVSLFGIQEKSTRTMIKKCIDCIWDVLTTLEYMVTNGVENTTEEQRILIFRLEATQKSFDDFTPSLTQSEIDVIVRMHEGKRDIARKMI